MSRTTNVPARILEAVSRAGTKGLTTNELEVELGDVGVRTVREWAHVLTTQRIGIKRVYEYGKRNVGHFRYFYLPTKKKGTK